MDIGINIKNVRKKNKLTQQALANMIGKSSRTIQSYENNEVSPPLDVLTQLADVLETTVYELMGQPNISSEGFEIKNNGEKITISLTDDLYEFDENNFNLQLKSLLDIIGQKNFYEELTKNPILEVVLLDIFRQLNSIEKGIVIGFTQDLLDKSEYTQQYTQALFKIYKDKKQTDEPTE